MPNPSPDMDWPPIDLSPTEQALLAELQYGPATPAVLASRTDYSPPHVRQALADLQRHQLVSRPGTGLYEHWLWPLYRQQGGPPPAVLMARRLDPSRLDDPRERAGVRAVRDGSEPADIDG